MNDQVHYISTSGKLCITVPNPCNSREAPLVYEVVGSDKNGEFKYKQIP